MRNTALRKEYEKFRETLFENVSNSFAQLPIGEIAINSVLNSQYHSQFSMKKGS